MRVPNIIIASCIIITFVGIAMFACYKGDPGYGNVDYPPDNKLADGGCG